AYDRGDLPVRRLARVRLSALPARERVRRRDEERGMIRRVTCPGGIMHRGKAVRKSHIGWLVVLALGMGHGGAFAQTPYPNKAVWVISPLGSSGAVEIMGRLVTRKMSESMGQQFLIDSKVGAGGSVGHEAAARAAPDGYTLLLTGSGYAIMPWLYSLKFDPFKDLVPVSQMSLGSFLLMVPNALPVKTVKDLVALAKAKPGALNFGSAGVGSSVHFASETLAAAAGIKLTHVPYKDLGRSYIDLIAGEIQLIMSNTIS